MFRTLSRLSSSTQYYYQCGDFSTGTVSGVLSFTTLPAPGVMTPLSFGVLGDLGTTSDSVTTVEHMIANRNLSMLLHVGDLSYSDCDATKWDTYGLMVENLARERVSRVCVSVCVLVCVCVCVCVV